MKAAIGAFAKEHGLRATEWLIFECSGTAAGQLTAYGLLVHGATLSVVGFTMDKVEVRLSNLMAFDARALGNWGCLPEHYPAALDLVLDGKVALKPFVESAPARRHQPRVRRRPPPRDRQRAVLVPASLRNPRMNAPTPRRARIQEPRSRRRLRQAAASATRSRRRGHPDGKTVPGLYNAWITLDNPTQFNSYTTDMVKGVILAFRAASNARDVNCVVFTGAGDRAFCTGGNTKEYAEYYAGHPQEYRQYMRLFNDMVTAILVCDKPVICRVNGMRIAGGQEIGMACDFSVAQDLARFGQAGPKHGSAPTAAPPTSCRRSSASSGRW